MTVLDQYMPRVRAMFPELRIHSARLNTDGHQNVVVIVESDDGNWICRFAKTEDARARLGHELRLLDAIRPHLHIPIPNPVIREDDATAYRMVEGVPLTSWLIASLDPSVQQALADQLGGFLRTLHAMPPGLLPMREPQPGGEYFRKRHLLFQEVLYPLFDPHQREWVERLFADGAKLYARPQHDETVCLIHNDLKVGHILFDPNTNRLSGILDFGIACYDVPDIDICNLLQCFGETFVTRMLSTYPAARALLPRARFAVHVMELEALCDGIVENKRHLLVRNVAVPRDVRFPVM